MRANYGLLIFHKRPHEHTTGDFASAVVSEVRAENLGIISDRTGRGDGMGMNIARGAAELQAQALEYDLTPAEVAQAARGTAGYLSGIATAGKNMPAAIAAAAQLSRGQPNAKTGASQLKNPDAVRLGEEIGLSVMGQVPHASTENQDSEGGGKGRQERTNRNQVR